VENLILKEDGCIFIPPEFKIIGALLNACRLRVFSTQWVEAL
jgi:hypothetical protein